MPLTTSYEKYLARKLRNPRMASAYLNAALQDGDPDLFLKALRKVAEANGNIAGIARKAKVSRVGLYKALSRNGNPGFRTVSNILRAFDLTISVRP